MDLKVLLLDVRDILFTFLLDVGVDGFRLLGLGLHARDLMLLGFLLHSNGPSCELICRCVVSGEPASVDGFGSLVKGGRYVAKAERCVVLFEGGLGAELSKLWLSGHLLLLLD